MGWNEVDEKLTRELDLQNVVELDDAERQQIRSIVLEEFPRLSPLHIEEAISSCCARIPAPRGRDHFVRCLSQELRE